mmetsp:Transcript_85302/g.204346  ORF Transcript_85302/g.204346 Transcript_85302/m.204346 type:complete len:221 (-) Transcript_85302:23-685(-)|eukprot:CAMPEP_0181449488 /NCGR_PEP_ID=MMETSP1110-20121109/27682_1 /TAXON_ID=174948 /ORGANISM="Symbiodinium sp., Strain CCMP421" /LENGTH=220 /DNA_ID=CAMNT_0023573671 /DNA_START=45 /DNA_END=707 /DNA_ORIENTATION=+
MGTAASLFRTERSGPSSVLVLGLDNAGKTVMIQALCAESDVRFSSPIRGISFKEALVKMPNEMNLVTMFCWDVGGRCSLRPYLRRFYENADGIIYVVDSADRKRFEQAGDELRQILQDELLLGKPLLVLANKQDLISARPGQEITDALGLHGLRDRPWHVQETAVKRQEGLLEGLAWLHSTVDETPRGLAKERKAIAERTAKEDDTSTVESDRDLLEAVS